MFADNERISSRQLLCQVVLAMTGAFLLFLPGFGEIQGIKGVVCCGLGFVLAAAYCFFLVRIAPAYRNPEKILGKVGAKLLGLWFLSYFVLTGAFLTSLITRVIGTYLVTGVSPYVIHAVLLVACASAGIPKVQRRGRMAEACFGVLIGLVALLLVLAFVQQDWAYLEQEFVLDVRGAAFGAYEIFAAFTGIGALPFILGQVKERRLGSMIGACAILAGILALVLVLLQGSYGALQVQKRPWPVIALMAGIRIPGAFPARFDPLWISLFLFLMFFAIGSTLFYGNYIVKRTELHIPWYWILLAVYLVSVTRCGGFRVEESYGRLLLYIYTPTMLVINLAMGLVRRPVRNP